MYSTKTIHPHINPNYKLVYNTIGDPYKVTRDQLPERWKSKQFLIPKIPKNEHNGYFRKLKYHAEPYIELGEKYTKTQPLDQRKLGFGSHDAYKSSEFTSTKATDRYRSLVHKELIQSERSKDKIKEKMLLDKWKSRQRKWVPPKDLCGTELKFPKHLYDYGKSNVTPYNPNSSRDSFYKAPIHAPITKGKGAELRRLGSHRPMSASIGEKAWEYNYVKPRYGNTHTISSFFDKGHLEIQGV